MKELLIGLMIVLLIGYSLFCAFLICVDLPGEVSRHRFQFSKEPIGFIKYSRIIGNVIMWMIIAGIVLEIAYFVGNAVTGKLPIG